MRVLTQKLRTVRPGFSLMELAVYMAVVAFLTLVIAPGFLSYIAKGRKTNAQQTVKAVQVALQSFNLDTTRWPHKLHDLVKRPSDPAIAPKWSGPYLEQDIADDPWGNTYMYKATPGQEKPYELYSHGPNGPGAPKEERISVWAL